MDERISGIVTDYIEDRGFGFLTYERAKNDWVKCFFHISEWEGGEYPVKHQQVSFEVLPYQVGNKPTAVKVK